MNKQTTPNFDYPKVPPTWLKYWITRSELDRMVPTGLRQYALEIGVKEGIQTLDWNDTTLRLRVGRQECVWTLMDDKTWKTSCSCGYPKPNCAHTFLAGYLFNTVARTEDWQNTAPLFAFNQKTDGPPRPTAKKNQPETEPEKSHLEIEADFHHRPGNVAVRIYQVDDQMRKLLSMQRLYNLAMRIRYSESATRYWHPAESEFLKWIAGEIKRRPEVKKNLNLLNLTLGRFQRWVERWADTDLRLLERSGQTPINAETGPAHIEIHVEDDDTHLRLNAMVVPASGAPVPFPKVFKTMQAGHREILVNGVPTTIESGMSWQALCELFGQKNPRLAKEHVEEHLATVIEGRFDLLRGDAVVVREHTERARIEATPDGAETILSLTVHEHPAIIDCMTAFQPPKQDNGRFVVNQFKPKNSAELTHFFNSIEARPGDSPDTVRVPGRSDAVERLAKAWRKLPDSVEKRCDPTLNSLLNPAGTPPQPELTLHDRGVFFNTTMQWRIGDAVLRHDVIHAAIAKQKTTVRGDSGRWIHLEPAWANTILNTADSCGFGRDGTRRFFLPELQNTIETIKSLAEHSRLHAKQSCLNRVLKDAVPDAPACPPAIKKQFRPYQHTGFNFLADRFRYGIGCILADDMGLGKTVQALALLNAAHTHCANSATPPARRRHSLVVCPASVLSVWIEEAKRFAPELRFQLYCGPLDERRQWLQNNHDFDVLLTNYAIVRQDIEVLANTPFAIGVLDEAQNIKNPKAQITEAVKALDIQHRIALTGTPLENHPLDLWSIMDFLNPDYLGDHNTFATHHTTTEGNEKLARRLAPVMLRRTKKMVAPELPERIEETITIELSEQERQFYEQLRNDATSGLKSKGTMEILTLITRLRQTCCAPELTPGGQGLPSTKIETALDIIEELVDENHSVLVFSQFVKLLDILDARLDAKQIPAWKITGATPVHKRPRIVDQFTDDTRPGVMLLSLKAAGTGLTLTKADYVILFDPWWNPAVENQAIDRTHRIGQKQNVIAYRLVASQTVEESVQKLKAAKQELFNSVIEGAATTEGEKLSREILEQILTE